MSEQQAFDFCIIGAGIVGLSTAYNIRKKFPNAKIAIIEKEKTFALHQTGRNSGVIHSGIYYKPNSQKALNCRSGKKILEKFCLDHDINFELCGKVIVATDKKELPKLKELYSRGLSNGVDCELISKNRLLEIEPHAKGVEAIHVKECGIIDYTAVCKKLTSLIKNSEYDQFFYNFEVTKIKKLKNKQILIQSKDSEILSQTVVNCAGLYSDKIAKISGANPSLKIIPFKGEYFKLKKSSQHLCKNLIYPVPDPKFPFLGVHFTRGIDGSVECGPNAVFSFGKESYKKFDVNFFEALDSICYPGFLKMASQHWKMGLGEIYRSFNKLAFTKALQRLVPEIQSKDMISSPSGIRAQSIDSSGNLIDDFVIETEGSIVNVCNAPSPAATSCFGIADTIVSKLYL